jgi:hypothetical protein
LDERDRRAAEWREHCAVVSAKETKLRAIIKARCIDPGAARNSAKAAHGPSISTAAASNSSSIAGRRERAMKKIDLPASRAVTNALESPSPPVTVCILVVDAIMTNLRLRSVANEPMEWIKFFRPPWTGCVLRDQTKRR